MSLLRLSSVLCLWLAVIGCAGGDASRRSDRADTRGDGHDDDDDDHDAAHDRQVERELQEALMPVAAPRKTGPLPERPASFKDATTMSVHLLDVGQGAATLLEFPCGAVLIDTGGEVNSSFNSVSALMTQLEAFFARRSDLKRTLDLLVITHPHIDHVRGIPLLLESYAVKNVVDNGHDGDALVKDGVGALRALVGRGAGYRAINNTEIVKKSGLIDDVIDPIACAEIDPKIRVLSGGLNSDPGWGTSTYGKRHFENENNHSVVVRVDFGNASILITGDLEEVAIKGLVERYRDTRWLDVDVYQAGHHGSANGTTLELVAATTPLVALIAMGDEARHHSWTAWAYGHPRATIVDMLDNVVAFKRPKVEVPVGTGVKKFVGRTLEGAIYGTGWDGAVVVDMNVEGDVVVRRRAAAPAR